MYTLTSPLLPASSRIASRLGLTPLSYVWAAFFASMLMLGASANAQTPAGSDPYLWLEAVDSPQSLAWVRDRNTHSRAQLEPWSGFASTRQQIREVLDSSERIPQITRMGEQFYNLWQDAQHPRGIWRRTTLQGYRQTSTHWETVLDLDALGRAESVSWVWGGATCLGPQYRRCLVRLSRGGSDAVVVREFDTVSKTFVEGGFRLPEAKSSITWLNENTVFVATDFGADSLTTSGYPRIIKRWERGQALQAAATVFEGQRTDVSASVWVDRTPGHERVVFYRSPEFFITEAFLSQGDQRQRLNKPGDAQLTFWKDRVLLQLRSPWASGGTTWPSGALLVGAADAFLSGQPRWQVLFQPSATTSLASFSLTRDTVLLNLLENVASRLEEWRESGGAWQRRAVNTPSLGTLRTTALHDPLLANDPWAEHYLYSYTDFLTPDTLQWARTGGDERQTLRALPAFFDASGMRVEQRFARSADGTRVPYFIVWPAHARADGSNPTVLYGYGGFRVSQRPWYSGTFGRAWYARGGVLVVANIRGGGEYGPAWHQAAMKAHKQRSYDDFAAVAQDLIATGVTNAKQLGIRGGSNGGLLVGAVMLQRPELFGAVVCQVPLLDMQRYHLLLAGASWMAEYGNPDKPEEWAWIRGYSPYQNVRADMKLPPVLFTTSTRDDRVHPGHARKMAARMIEQGHRVSYYENIEGGHAGAADSAQRADMQALEFAFLWQHLSRRSALPAPPAAGEMRR